MPQDPKEWAEDLKIALALADIKPFNADDYQADIIESSPALQKAIRDLEALKAAADGVDHCLSKEENAAIIEEASAMTSGGLSLYWGEAMCTASWFTRDKSSWPHGLQPLAPYALLAAFDIFSRDASHADDHARWLRARRKSTVPYYFSRDTPELDVDMARSFVDHWAAHRRGPPEMGSPESALRMWGAFREIYEGYRGRRMSAELDSAVRGHIENHLGSLLHTSTPADNATQLAALSITR